MDMNPIMQGPDSQLVYKDGIFFSGHKFIGGPGCPGVLIIKKSLLPQSSIHPSMPGGGTVFFVTEDHHRYLSNREEREEGGTPDIIGDIRLGLVLHLKSSIGLNFIEAEEYRIASYVRGKLSSDPRMVVLGDVTTETKQLPIFSFLIRCQGRFLHYNFVCALLNDLFGVQSRGNHNR
jgi:selenocysteine lyase/cysteine desulfurase